MKPLIISVLFLSFLSFSGCSNDKELTVVTPDEVTINDDELFGNVSEDNFENEHIDLNDSSFNKDGLASWFGNEFNGRKTASGEICNIYEMTAAHNTIPFDSLVEVTNVHTGSSVVVRINDRGPFVGKRIINLSQLAARELGFIKKGLLEVTIKVIN